VSSPATTEDDRRALDDALVERIEQQITHRADLGGKGLIQYYRLLLQDLPFDGQPALLADEHRAALDKLVERASRHDIRLISIIGHTSQPGTEAYNQTLSQQRAQAVFDRLLQAVETSGLFSDNSLVASLVPEGRGESQPVQATADERDHPLNRRVEVAYRLRIDFPQPSDAVVPRSRHWKIDFSAGGGGFGVEVGLGTLTMLPDESTGQADTLSQALSYESFGVAIGLAPFLKKLRWLKRWPRLRKLVGQLDPRLPGNYRRTEEILGEVGFSVDLMTEGGEFATDEPLSFAEMARFNFASVTGNLSLGGGAAGTLVLLHSPYFFATTVMYGVSMALTMPDASLDFVPAAVVQLQGY